MCGGDDLKLYKFDYETGQEIGKKNNNHTLRKWKSGCHSLSRFMILAAPFMVSGSHSGQGAGSGWHPVSTGRSHSHFMILAATIVILAATFVISCSHLAKWLSLLITEFPTC